MSDTLDHRLFAYRPDLAEEALKGQVEAKRFVPGEPAHVIEPVIDIRPRPDLSAIIDSQALYGETLRVLDRQDGWAWILKKSLSIVSLTYLKLSSCLLF